LGRSTVLGTVAAPDLAVDDRPLERLLGSVVGRVDSGDPQISKKLSQNASRY